MGPRLSRGALAALLLLLSGCTSAPASAPAPFAEEAAPAPAATFTWNGCRGAILILEGVTALYPPSAPAGWESGNPTLYLRVTLLECDRVSWGAFERGPVAIAQEWRTDLAPPPGCLRDGTDGTQLLEAIWFSDPDIAAFAVGHGLPAGAMEATVRPLAHGQEWTWGPPGDEASSALFAEATGGNQSDQIAERLLWADGDGVGALDLHVDETRGALTPPASTGFLRPPTLYGRANASPAFATPRGHLVLDVEADGALQRFGDPACERPL